MNKNDIPISVIDILKTLEKKYETDIQILEIGNQFETWKAIIKDPHNQGLTVFISFNSSSDPSVFNTELFHFGRFNIAEGYTEKDLIHAAESVMSGKAKVEKKFLSCQRLVIQTSLGEVDGKLKAGNNSVDNLIPFVRC